MSQADSFSGLLAPYSRSPNGGPLVGRPHKQTTSPYVAAVATDVGTPLTASFASRHTPRTPRDANHGGDSSRLLYTFGAHIQELGRWRRGFLSKETTGFLTGEMTNDLQVPTKIAGIAFAVGFFFFIAFAVVLVSTAVADRDPRVSRMLHRTVESAVTALNYQGIADRDDLSNFLATLIDTPLANNTLGNPNNYFVGAVMLSQIRSPKGSCGSVPPALAAMVGQLRCLTDVENGIETEDYNSTAFPALRYRYWSEGALCFGTICDSTLQSVVRPSTISYGMQGYRLLLYNQTLWSEAAADTAPIPLLTANTNFPYAPFLTSTYSNATVGALMADFIDSETREVLVCFGIYNPVFSSFASAYILFELPLSGGVFPFLHITVTSLKDSDFEALLFLWIFSGLYLLRFVLLLFRVVWNQSDCQACADKHSTLVFNCLKCDTRVELTVVVRACAKCGAPVPSLKHRCWRAVVFDVWTLSMLVCLGFFAASSFLLQRAKPYIRDRVAYGFAEMARGGVPVVSLQTASTMISHGRNLAAVSIVVVFLKLFRESCRGQVNSRFVRVFAVGLPPLVAFTATFLVTFTAFFTAFYVMVGDTSYSFATAGRAALTSFRVLIGSIDWQELGTGPGTAPLMVTYCLYYIACATLMFNVFPSVLSVAYKNAIKTPYYDTDVLSLWLILKPYMRRLGFVKESSGRNMRKATMTLDPNEAASCEMQPVECGPAGQQYSRDDLTSDPRRDANEDFHSLAHVQRMQALNAVVRHAEGVPNSIHEMFESLHTQLSGLQNQVNSLSAVVPEALTANLVASVTHRRTQLHGQQQAVAARPAGGGRCALPQSLPSTAPLRSPAADSSVSLVPSNTSFAVQATEEAGDEVAALIDAALVTSKDTAVQFQFDFYGMPPKATDNGGFCYELERLFPAKNNSTAVLCTSTIAHHNQEGAEWPLSDSLSLEELCGGDWNAAVLRLTCYEVSVPGSKVSIGSCVCCLRDFAECAQQRKRFKNGFKLLGATAESNSSFAMPHVRCKSLVVFPPAPDSPLLFGREDALL